MEKLKFTKEIKTEWLKALKSGKYVQGTETLKNGGDVVATHCCLGVLCEIHPRLSIKMGGEGRALLDGLNTGEPYIPLYDMLGEETCIKIATDNDKNCDTKYTTVIPIIESLTTED